MGAKLQGIPGKTGSSLSCFRFLRSAVWPRQRSVFSLSLTILLPVYLPVYLVVHPALYPTVYLADTVPVHLVVYPSVLLPGYLADYR